MSRSITTRVPNLQLPGRNGIFVRVSGTTVTITDESFALFTPKDLTDRVTDNGAVGGSSSSGTATGVANLKPGCSPRLKSAQTRVANGGDPIHIGLAGDSTTLGGGATDYNTKSGAARLIEILNTKYPIFGKVRKGLTPFGVNGPDNSPGAAFGYVNYTDWTWTPPYPVTDFIVWYLCQPPTGAGTFTAKINGTLKNTVDISVGEFRGIAPVKIHASDTPGTYTLRLDATAGFVYGWAIEAWDDTQKYGAKISKFGYSGAASNDLTTVQYDKGGYWFTKTDLMILKWGINNGTAIRDAATYLKTDLLSEGAQAVARKSDLLIESPHGFGDPITGGDTTHGIPPIVTAANKAAADQLGVPFVDLQARWLNYPADIRTAFNASDHPSDAAYYDEAMMLAGVLRQLAEL